MTRKMIGGDNMKQKGEKKGLSEWVSGKLDIPADVFPGAGMLELRGRNTLTLRGCRHILKYTPDEMCFQMDKSRLIVTGKRLVCTSYLTGAVVIDGFVCSISFDGEEETV